VDEVAEALKIDRSNIYRWLDNETSPHGQYLVGLSLVLDHAAVRFYEVDAFHQSLNELAAGAHPVETPLLADGKDVGARAFRAIGSAAKTVSTAKGGRRSVAGRASESKHGHRSTKPRA